MDGRPRLLGGRLSTASSGRPLLSPLPTVDSDEDDRDLPSPSVGGVQQYRSNPDADLHRGRNSHASDPRKGERSHSLLLDDHLYVALHPPGEKFDSDKTQWMESLKMLAPRYFIALKWLALLPSSSSAWRAFNVVIRTAVWIGFVLTCSAFVAGAHEHDLTFPWSVDLVAWLTVWGSYALNHLFCAHFLYKHGAYLATLMTLPQQDHIFFLHFQQRIRRSAGWAVSWCVFWLCLMGGMYGGWWYPRGDDQAMEDLQKLVGTPVVDAAITVFMLIQFHMVGGLAMFVMTVWIISRIFEWRIKRLTAAITERPRSAFTTVTPFTIWKEMELIKEELDAASSKLKTNTTVQFILAFANVSLLAWNALLHPPSSAAPELVGLDVFMLLHMTSHVLLIGMFFIFYSGTAVAYNQLVEVFDKSADPKLNMVQSAQGYRLWSVLHHRPVGFTFVGLTVQRKTVWLFTVAALCIQLVFGLWRLK